jgi:hypothetical protein
MAFEVKEINKYIVASDTDSIFVNLEPLLKKKWPDLDLTDKEETLEKVKILQKEIEHKVNDYQNVLAKNILNSTNHYFDLKSESIIQKAYWAGKRRYAQLIVDKEGVPVEELDIKGMDIMKSNMTPMYAKFGESLIMDIMYGKPKKEIDKKIQDFRKKLKTISYKEIAKPTGVKKIREYIASPPTAGQMFSKLGLKCPINTKSAIYYNDLLKFKGLDKEYSCITEGDKIQFIPLKKNPYNLPVLAFTKESPQFIYDFLEKYADTDSGFDNVLLNKLQGIYDDIWGPNSFPSLNPNVEKFFNF